MKGAVASGDEPQTLLDSLTPFVANTISRSGPAESPNRDIDAEPKASTISRLER
jgi:hypothetical protein